MQMHEAYGFEFNAMGGTAEIRLAGLNEARAAELAQQAMAEVQRIEHTYSRYRPDSIVSRINAAAGQDVLIDVDEETAGLLGFADQLWQLGGGLFDITSGVLRRAWDFRRTTLPDQADIEALLPLIGWNKVTWLADTHQLALPQHGMELDFGGFGKEYAADRAATVLMLAGATSGFVNLGGDIRVVGPQPDGSPWRMGVQHPRLPEATLGSVAVRDGALATSGDYERFMTVDGQRYCHILDPRNGWPVQCWQSVTVAAPVCTAAGALSTLAMLMQERAEAFLQTQGVPWLAVDAAGQVHHHGL